MKWDIETDVLVAGYGCAGAVAAITAHDADAEVLLVEKAPHFGGLAVLCGGGVVIADDAENAFTYLKASCGGRTPDDVIRVFAKGLTTLKADLEELVARVAPQTRVVGMGTSDVLHASNFSTVDRCGTYPFPGNEAFYLVKVGPIQNFVGYPWARGQRAGVRFWKVLADNVEVRKIPTWFSSPIKDLVRDESGAVSGAIVEHEGRMVRIRARQAVILGTGGFENGTDLKIQFFETPAVYPVCSLRNTGDGIKVAQRAGAALWHMWFFHGGYGVKRPEFPFAFHNRITGPRDPNRKMPWILVDKYARQFMNEYPPDVSDTSVRFLQYFDPDRQEYPRIPSYMIFDEVGRQVGPICGYAANDDEVVTDERVPNEWSLDNLAEIKRGWIKKAATMEELASQLGLNSGTLGNTVEGWNKLCASGADDEFGRLPGTRVPIVQPPFYGVEISPIVYNTQGGPQHDVKQRVLDPFGNPIPGLYAVGDLGSLFGHVYLLGANISECIIGGKIAGNAAAASTKPPSESRKSRKAISGELLRQIRYL